MNTLIIFTILALASPIFGDENVEAKKQEKRGLAGLGYGGHYPIGAHGLTGYTGYGGFGGYGHGYIPSVYPVSHGLNHGFAATPYSAPALASYSHGYNHHAPSLLTAAAPWRSGYHGYNGVHGAAYGHGLGYGW